MRGSDPGRPPGMRPDCTSLPIAPAVDGALVVAGGMAAWSAHRQRSEEEDFDREFLRFQRDWALVGALFELGASVYGFVRTARCRRELRAFDREQSGRGVAPAAAPL